MPSARRATAPATEASATPGPRVLKKYPNRRLYDTQTSSYITLADVKRMVLAAAGGSVSDLQGAPLRYGKPGFENPHFVACGVPAARRG